MLTEVFRSEIATNFSIYSTKNNAWKLFKLGQFDLFAEFLPISSNADFLIFI